MQRIMSIIVHSPVRSALLIPVITLMFSWGLNDLFVDASSEGLMTKEDPDSLYLTTIKKDFGDAILHSVIIKSDTVFRKDVLQKILDITSDASAINGVDRVVSLATVSNLKGWDDTLSTEPLLIKVPQTGEEMDILKQDAVGNPMFTGEVLNKTGSVTAIHLFLNNTDKQKDFDGRILEDIGKIVRQAQQDLSQDVEIYHIGSPRVKTRMAQAVNHDGLYLAPLAGAAMFIVLMLFFRNVSLALIPFFTGILSIVSTIGFMGVMGFGFNPISIIVPTLVFVMGGTEDIHLISEYLHELETGVQKKTAVLNMAIKSGAAIFLTALTTLMGFLTIAPNAIPMLREFGIAAAFGIAVNFIITILAVPTLLNLCPSPKTASQKESLPFIFIREFVFVCITRYRFFVAAFFILCLSLSLWGIQKIQIETDYIKFFKKDSDVPILFEKLKQDMAGRTNLLVVVESRTPGAFLTYAGLSQVGRLYDYLNKHHGKAVGYVDMVRKTHQEMNDGEKDYFVIPDNDNLIAQYTLMMDTDNLSRFVNHDFSKTAILLKTLAAGTRETMLLYDDINRYARENLTHDLECHVTGEIIVVSKSSNTITRELIINLCYMLIAIFLVISLVFRSLKAGAMAMIPNIIPVVINFGYMGIMEIPLSTATFPVAIIALGIAVDDTIHFMVRYANEIKHSDSTETAVMNSLKKEIRPILSTSMALIAGCSMLVFAQFGSTIQFGKLSALCMLTALISDLFLTPLLLIQNPLR